MRPIRRYKKIGIIFQSARFICGFSENFVKKRNFFNRFVNWISGVFGKKSNLFRALFRQPVDRRQKGVVKRGFVRFFKARFYAFLVVKFRLVAFGLWGVFRAGHNDSSAFFGHADADECVKDNIVFVKQDNVAVSSHKFDDDEEVFHVLHFGARGQRNSENSVVARNRNILDRRAEKMLSQKHTEGGGGIRVFLFVVCDMDSRGVGVCRRDESVRRAARIHDETNLVLFGLVYFLYFPRRKKRIKFFLQGF